MQTEHLRYLITVVEQGSMTKAANTLYCTQPAISNALKTLEKEVGGAILVRPSNVIELTPLGRHIYEEAKLIIGLLDEWKDSAQTAASTQEIRLLFTSTFPRHKIIGNILKQQQKKPSLKINVKFSPLSSRPFDFAEERFVRICIMYNTPNHTEDVKKYCTTHGLELARLDKTQFCLFANKDNELICSEEPIFLNDLKSKNILMLQDPDHFPYISRLKNIGCHFETQFWQEENLFTALSIDKNMLSIRPRDSIEISNSFYNISCREISDFQMPINLCILFPNSKLITSSEKDFIKDFLQDFNEHEILT